MSQVLALITSDAALLRCELDRVRARFPFEPGSVVGIGGWQDGQVVQRRYGLGAPTEEAWEAPDSEVAMLASRLLGVGQGMEDSAQPFRFRQWLFAAAGTLERGSAVRERLREELPEFLAAAVRGPTWEEAAFARFLAELREIGRIEDGQLDAATAAARLGSCAKAIEQVSGGAGVTASLSSNIVVGAFANARGAVQLTGVTLTVTNQLRTAQIIVGQIGTGSFVQNGGTLTVDQFNIGTVYTSNRFLMVNSYVTTLNAGYGQATLSNGQILTRLVNVGVATNSQGMFTIAGGTLSVASNMTAGAFSSATGVIQVNGGNLAVTNTSSTAQLIVGQVGRGTYIQTGGSTTVDRLLAINGTNSVFSFVSGLFSTKSTTVSNSQTFAIGDGVGAANYHLLGGIHSFADGLHILNHSALSGCGTINGAVLVDAGGKVLTDCGGALTFTGSVTNNGSMQAINGSVLEFYGPVVNNGVINIINGQTNFHAGFVNNGLVITSNDIPVITSIKAVGFDMWISVKTGNGPHYIFEERNSLVGSNWTPVLEFIGTGSIEIFIDPNAATLQNRFYRIGLVIPQ